MCFLSVLREGLSAVRKSRMLPDTDTQDTQTSPRAREQHSYNDTPPPPRPVPAPPTRSSTRCKPRHSYNASFARVETTAVYVRMSNRLCGLAFLIAIVAGLCRRRALLIALARPQGSLGGAGLRWRVPSWRAPARPPPLQRPPLLRRGCRRTPKAHPGASRSPPRGPGCAP